jgi:hypothetical protein
MGWHVRLLTDRLIPVAHKKTPPNNPVASILRFYSITSRNAYALNLIFVSQ